MTSELRPALLVTAVLTVLMGIVYPLLVTGLAGIFLPYQAAGSLVVRNSKVIGSELIGQSFTQPQYFHPRPSAAGEQGYDATASGGSNLGPTDRRLIARIEQAVTELRRENPTVPVPIDLVTASGSGLDPDITPAAAEFQVPRVARARSLPQDVVRRLVARYTEGRQLGILGEARVNVLRLNLALDALPRR
jgi:potassium-transporting ATPase KdpC subunit